MSDGGDPRGHDDGDIFFADPDRVAALRVEIKKLVIDMRRNHIAVQAAILELATEMGYDPNEIADMLEAEARVLRHGQLRGQHLGTDGKP